MTGAIALGHRWMGVRDQTACPIVIIFPILVASPLMYSIDRIELAEAHDTTFPMGRYTAKHGDALYMSYIQTNNLAAIIARLNKFGHRWTRRTNTEIERDGLWIHPSALNGVLLGVSRSSLAWGWSGKPEWVEALPNAG